MHLAGTTYEEAYSTFRWEVPARFNIARAICDDHAAAHPMRRRCSTSRPTAGCAPWSFAEIQAAANRFANVLGAFGVAPGTIVGIHLPQCPESLIAHVAIQKRGAIALPMFNLFGPDAIAYRLGDSGARVLISTPDALERNAEALAASTRSGMSSASAARVLHRAGFLAARRARIPARRNRRHRPRRSGAADLHLGDHRQPERRAACGPRAARPPAGRDHAARFLPAAGRPLLDAGRLGLGRRTARRAVAVALPRRGGGGAVRTKFDPEWAFAFMARHGIRNIFMPPTALRLMRQVPDPARAACLRAALARHRRREAGRGHDGLGPRDLRPGARRVLRPERGQPGDQQLAQAVSREGGLDGPRRPRPCRRGGG